MLSVALILSAYQHDLGADAKRPSKISRGSHEGRPRKDLSGVADGISDAGSPDASGTRFHPRSAQAAQPTVTSSIGYTEDFLQSWGA